MEKEKIKTSLKEELAKFLENPSRENLRDFLRNNLGEFENCDFKEKWCDLTKLAKHILAFSNSGGGAMFFGVLQKEDNTFNPIGLQEIKDKADITKGIEKFIHPKIVYGTLDFSYEESEYPKIKGKKFQVLIVEDTPRYVPFVCSADSEDTRRGAIYVRDKTESKETSYEQLQGIINRRIETGYSSKRENELENHLIDLETLYNRIPKYHVTVSSPFFTNLQIMAERLIQVEQRRVKNPKYPSESFEDFILKMIESKKGVIKSIIEGDFIV